jgi:hypothetical protein
MARATNLTKALNAINVEIEHLRKKKVDAILRPLHRERRKLEARIEKIDQLLNRAMGKLVDRRLEASISIKRGPKGKKRTRRSADDLKKIANRVLEFVKSKGKAGVTPAEIKAGFGQLFPSPLQFVKKHGGVEFRRRGPAKRPRYSLG